VTDCNNHKWRCSDSRGDRCVCSKCGFSVDTQTALTDIYTRSTYKINELKHERETLNDAIAREQLKVKGLQQQLEDLKDEKHLEVSLYSGLVKTFKEMFDWAQANDKMSFTRKEVSDFVEIKNSESSRLGDLALFGFCFIPKKALYVPDKHFCEDFFAGRVPVFTKVVRVKGTGKILSRSIPKYFREIVNITELLDDEGIYKTNYVGAPSAEEKENV